MAQVLYVNFNVKTMDMVKSIIKPIKKILISHVLQRSAEIRYEIVSHSTGETCKYCK